jgi:hypothetical protein
MSVLSKPCGEPEAGAAAFAAGRLDARLPHEAVALGVGVSPAVERGLDARLERIAARLLAWGHTPATSRAGAHAARTAAEGDVGA